MLVVEDLIKRDFIAIEAMKAIIAGCSNAGVVSYDAGTLAKSAYVMADEMIARSAMPTKYSVAAHPSMEATEATHIAKEKDRSVESFLLRVESGDDFPDTTWAVKDGFEIPESKKASFKDKTVIDTTFIKPKEMTLKTLKEMAKERDLAIYKDYVQSLLGEDKVVYGADTPLGAYKAGVYGGGGAGVADGGGAGVSTGLLKDYREMK